MPAFMLLTPCQHELGGVFIDLGNYKGACKFVAGLSVKAGQCSFKSEPNHAPQNRTDDLRISDSHPRT